MWYCYRTDSIVPHRRHHMSSCLGDGRCWGWDVSDPFWPWEHDLIHHELQELLTPCNFILGWLYFICVSRHMKTTGRHLTLDTATSLFVICVYLDCAAPELGTGSHRSTSCPAALLQGRKSAGTQMDCPGLRREPGFPECSVCAASHKEEPLSCPLPGLGGKRKKCWSSQNDVWALVTSRRWLQDNRTVNPCVQAPWTVQPISSAFLAPNSRSNIEGHFQVT